MKYCFFYDMPVIEKKEYLTTSSFLMGIEEEDGKIIKVFRMEKDGGTLDLQKETGVGCCVEETPILKKAGRELSEYFKGERKTFDLPIHMEGTAFQKKVWQALLTIPYGETRSYQEIAIQINNPKAMRAVGGANHNNQIMILVPCHRVIGADGSLTGFGGGLDLKRFLLELESGK